MLKYCRGLGFIAFKRLVALSGLMGFIGFRVEGVLQGCLKVHVEGFIRLFLAYL